MPYKMPPSISPDALDRDFYGRQEDTRMPMWAKIVFGLGAPTAGLAYVIWWILNVQTAKMDSLIDNQSKMAISQEQSAANTGHLIMLLERQDTILRQICWNGGRTAADRNACYQR